MRDVILIHGLWVPSLVMAPLAARLQRWGFRAHCFSYHGRRASVAAHAARLLDYARGIAPEGSHLVAHSLGGLVAVEAAHRAAGYPLGRSVLMGTPARGCHAGRRLAALGWGRWLLGASETLWRDGRRLSWMRPEPLGVVAGTRPFGLGRVVLGPLAGANDGVVTIDETTVDGMRDRVALPVGHSGMLVAPRVAQEVCAFLRDGRFLASAR